VGGGGFVQSGLQSPATLKGSDRKTFPEGNTVILVVVKGWPEPGVIRASPQRESRPAHKGKVGSSMGTFIEPNRDPNMRGGLGHHGLCPFSRCAVDSDEVGTF